MRIFPFLFPPKSDDSIAPQSHRRRGVDANKINYCPPLAGPARKMDNFPTAFQKTMIASRPAGFSVP